MKDGSISKGMQRVLGKGCGNLDNIQTWQQMLRKHPQQDISRIIFPEVELEDEDIDLEGIMSNIRRADIQTSPGPRGFRINLLKGLIQLSDEKAKKAISNYIKLGKLFITRNYGKS